MAIDVQLNVGFLEHPKVVKLRRRLGPDAVLALIKLWCAVRTSKPDGNLGIITSEDVEIMSGWNGTPDKFFETIVDLRLVDIGTNGDVSIHDWDEHESYSVRKSEHSRINAENGRKGGLAKAGRSSKTENNPSESVATASEILANATNNPRESVATLKKSPSIRVAKSSCSGVERSDSLEICVAETIIAPDDSTPDGGHTQTGSSIDVPNDDQEPDGIAAFLPSSASSANPEGDSSFDDSALEIHPQEPRSVEILTPKLTFPKKSKLKHDPANTPADRVFAHYNATIETTHYASPKQTLSNIRGAISAERATLSLERGSSVTESEAADFLIACIDRYKRSAKYIDGETHHRFKATNFFGTHAEWTIFRSDDSPAMKVQPRALVDGKHADGRDPVLRRQANECFRKNPGCLARRSDGPCGHCDAGHGGTLYGKEKR